MFDCVYVYIVAINCAVLYFFKAAMNFSVCVYVCMYTYIYPYIYICNV